MQMVIYILAYGLEERGVEYKVPMNTLMEIFTLANGGMIRRMELANLKWSQEIDMKGFI